MTIFFNQDLVVCQTCDAFDRSQFPLWPFPQEISFENTYHVGPLDNLFGCSIVDLVGDLTNGITAWTMTSGNEVFTFIQNAQHFVIRGNDTDGFFRVAVGNWNGFTGQFEGTVMAVLGDPTCCNVPGVPEPSTFMLVGIGLFAGWCWNRLRRNHA